MTEAEYDLEITRINKDRALELTRLYRKYCAELPGVRKVGDIACDKFTGVSIIVESVSVVLNSFVDPKGKPQPRYNGTRVKKDGTPYSRGVSGYVYHENLLDSI